MSSKILNRIKKSLRGNKQGFSLVELLVCVAILGVIAICVSVMMSAGTNTFTKINKRVNVSYRTQLALTQMKEFFIDCDAICKDENGDIYIQNTDKAGNKIVYLFTFDSGENKVFLETFGVIDEQLVSNGDRQQFANHISDFEINLNEARETGYIKTASVSITSKLDNQSNTRKQIFSLKNKPIFVDSTDQEGETILEAFAGLIGG